MKHLFRGVAVSALLILCELAAQCLASTRTVTIPFVRRGPVLRGDFSDGLWGYGPPLYDFVSTSADTPVTQQTQVHKTQVHMLYDSQNLYIAVLCDEWHLEHLVSLVRERDGPVWQDDSIELLFDTANGHGAVYHIIVNSIGTIYDEKCVDTEHADPSWNSTCRVKTGRCTDQWVVEIAIPAKDFGIALQPGLTWGLNVCRSRYAGVKEFSSWSPTPGGFVQPRNLGEMCFGDKDKERAAVEVLSWGSLGLNTSWGGRNVVECLVRNTTGKRDAVRVRFAHKAGSKSGSTSRKITISPGQFEKVEVPYTPFRLPNETYTLSVSSGSRLLFSSNHPSTWIPQSPRVWQLKDPLFEELLSKNPPGEQKNGVIYWFHSSDATGLRRFAEEYGLRYSLDEAYRELVEYKFLPVSNSSMITSEPMSSMADKYPFKVVLEPDYRHSRDVGVPQIDGLPYILDPRSKDAYFEDLRMAVAKRRDHIYGIYSYDEFTEKTVEQGVKLFEQMKDTYPLIREIDERVKNECGYEKYAMPTSPNDDNPFRWIAYRKWVNRQMLEWQKEVYETIRRIAPEIKVISFDPVAGHKPYDLDRITPYVDIVTHQLYPSANPNRQEFGFVTKLVTDLTGRPVWPCTHVENYAYSTTPEEVRELMSQVMRNGGKGFHLYIPDVRGDRASSGDTMLTKYGFPERFRAITEIVKLAERMNEVAVPTDPDCAILYSEDHYQSFPAISSVFPNDVEFAYTFLGPVARTWFKFVNDNMIEDGKSDLSRFKAVVVPAAKYERASVVKKLLGYVTGGGTLVCGDPEAFTWAPDGSSLSDVRETLFGAKVSSGIKRASISFDKTCPLSHLAGKKLPSTGETFDLSPAGAEVLARFEDETPAVIRNRIGKGSVILFAFDPFTEGLIGDSAWIDAFKALALDLGLRTDRSIWRFKFPPFKTVYLPGPKGVCLTGNYVRWSQEKPLDVQNAKLAGKYSYSLAPDAIPDRGDPAGVDFAVGKLMDRKVAPVTAKAELKPEDFIVSWASEKPVSLTFDLGGAHLLSRLHLWHSDQLPALTVEASIDGRSWTRLAEHPKQPTTPDVLDVEIGWKSPRKGRFLRISFGARDPGCAMTPAECEVWGSAP